MKRNEQKLQIHLVNVFRAVRPDKEIIFSVNNNSGSKAMGRINKAMGVLAGVSDLIILQKGRTLFVEVKTEKEKQKPVQVEFEAKVNAIGFQYEVVRNLDEFLEVIEWPKN